MKKKVESEPIRVPQGGEGVTPTGEVLVKMQLEMEIFEDGLLRFGDRLIWKHEKVSNGLANFLMMAAMAISKDSYLHKRWATIDRAYIEELEKRSKKAKAAIRKQRK